MSNLVNWAEKELQRLGTDDMQQEMNRDILAIVNTFAAQGHSGGSAAYALGIIRRLLNWKPIQPLTGEESEWREVSEGMEQNIRCSSVFRKNKDNSTAYDIEGKVFSGDGGETWYTGRESFVPITFPYNVPEKPEYVILNQEGKGHEALTFVTITKAEYENLLNDSEKLSCLEAAGVDNWEGYGDAMEMMEEGDDE